MAVLLAGQHMVCFELRLNRFIFESIPTPIPNSNTSCTCTDQDENVYSGLKAYPSAEEYSAKKSTATAAFIIAYICFFLDFISMLGGFSIFNASVNFANVFFHFIGGVFVSMYVRYTWQSSLLWTIVAISNVPVALVETWTLLSVCVFKRRLFGR